MTIQGYGGFYSQRLTDQPIHIISSLIPRKNMNMHLSAHPKRAMVTLTTFHSLEESQVLFDFDTPINEDNFIINSTSLVYKSKTPTQLRQKKLQVVSQQKAMNGEMPDFSFDPIFSLSITHQNQQAQYTLDQPQGMSDLRHFSPRVLDGLPFMCLNNHGRSNEVKSAKLKEGDFFRLGKTYFKVIETHLNQQESSFSNDLQPLMLEAITTENDPSLVKTCRICLMEDQEGLISPCKCKGSCEYVHLDCLKTWLKNKISRQDNRLVSSYFLTKFECELCKQQLPNKIISQGSVMEFVQFQRPDEPYIIIEKLQEDSRDKVIYVLTPKDQGVKLGRGNQSEVRFTDLTMSRTHSRIDFLNGQFYISDMGSKFGTLLLFQSHQKFQTNMCIQLLNKVYKFQVMKPFHPRSYSYL